MLFKILNLLGTNEMDSNALSENFRIVTDFDEDSTVKGFLEMDSSSDSSSKILPSKF